MRALALVTVFFTYGGLAHAGGAPCLPELSTSLKTLASLDELTLARIAERLAYTHAPTPADVVVREANAFFRAHPDRLTPVAIANYDLLRSLDLDLNDDEVALLATLVPSVRRNQTVDLAQRVREPNHQDLLVAWAEVLKRDEYRLGLVELLKRADHDELLRFTRQTNIALGAPVLNKAFEGVTVRDVIKRLKRRDDSLELMVLVLQMIEGVITKVIAYGRGLPDFRESIYQVNMPYVNTMVQTETLRRSAARYFADEVHMSSPPHVLRALVNTFGNVEPLPMSNDELRRQIGREAARFAKTL